MKKLYDFDGENVKNLIIRELKLFKGFKESFDYTVEKIIERGNSSIITSLDNIDLSHLEEDEGKNYHWSVIIYKDIRLLIRRYRQHFTFYSEFSSIEKYSSKVEYTKKSYASFHLIVKLKKDEDKDYHYDEPYLTIQKCLPNLFKAIEKEEMGLFWNSASLILPTNVERKMYFSFNKVFSTNGSIDSIDGTIFAMEELTSKYQQLYAEVDVIKLLSSFKIGDPIKDNGEDYYIDKINDKVEKEYYHSVGISLKTAGGKSKFIDVYSLLRWYPELLPDKLEPKPN
jgi:hypothetical protein